MGSFDCDGDGASHGVLVGHPPERSLHHLRRATLPPQHEHREALLLVRLREPQRARRDAHHASRQVHVGVVHCRRLSDIPHRAVHHHCRAGRGVPRRRERDRDGRVVQRVVRDHRDGRAVHRAPRDQGHVLARVDAAEEADVVGGIDVVDQAGVDGLVRVDVAGARGEEVGRQMLLVQDRVPGAVDGIGCCYLLQWRT